MLKTPIFSFLTLVCGFSLSSGSTFSIYFHICHSTVMMSFYVCLSCCPLRSVTVLFYSVFLEPAIKFSSLQRFNDIELTHSFI